MRNGSYVAVIRKDAKSDYGVEFPDVAGCFSAGSNLHETLEMATEALHLHLEQLAKDGFPKPPARSYAAIGALVVADDDVVALLAIPTAKAAS